jgi:hypothetical protein
MGLRSVLELADGRLVVLGASDSAPPGPRPPLFLQWFADVYSRRGVHELSIDLVSPTPGGSSITPQVAVSSPDARWLWVAGPLDFRDCGGGGPCEVVVRYDTTTGRLDETFGHGGVAVLAPDLVGITDMAPRIGSAQVYVSGTSASGTGTAITRLWDTVRPAG